MNTFKTTLLALGAVLVLSTQSFAQINGQAAERLQEMLGISEEEWSVLEPRMEAVISLKDEIDSVSGNAIGALSGRRFRGLSVGRGDSELALRSRELLDLTENQSTTPGQMKTAMLLVREARKAAEEQLVQRRAELRALLTTRQEALLLLMGVLN